MALSATHLVSASVGGSETQTVTTSAFTSVVNTLLVVFARADSLTTGVDLSITSNTGGLTFTQQLQNTQQSVDGGFVRCALWTAPVGSATVGMTVTIDAGASTKTAFLPYGVIYISDGTANVPQIKSGQIIANSEDDAGGNTETHVSGTLPAAATTGNVTAFFVGVQNDSTGPVSGPSSGGFSVLYETMSTATFEATGCATSTTFTGTSSTWVDLGNTVNNSDSILVEFEATGGAATGSSSSRTMPRFGPGAVGPASWRWQQIIGVSPSTGQNFASLGGTVTATGGLVKDVSKALAGTVTPVGALAKLVSKPFAGTVTPTGALAKLVGKVLGGTVTPTGALVKAVSKSLAGTVTPTGPLAKLTSKPLAGSTTPTGALVKLVGKVLGGTVTPTGTLTNIRVILRSFAGTVTPVGTLVKAVSKSLAGTVTPTGGLVRTCSKGLAGTVTAVGSLAKLVSKSFAGTVTPTGTLTNIRVLLRSFAGTVTPVGTLVRQAQKGLGGTVTPTGSIVRAVSKGLAGTVTAVGSLAKFVSRRFAGTVTAVGGLVAAIIGAGEPENNPITATIRELGRTATAALARARLTVTGQGATATARERWGGGTATVNEDSHTATSREQR